MFDRQHLGFEIDIGPAKGAQFAPAHAGQSGEHEERSQARVSPLGGFYDVAHHIQGRRFHPLLSDPGWFAISATFERTHPHLTA